MRITFDLQSLQCQSAFIQKNFIIQFNFIIKTLKKYELILVVRSYPDLYISEFYHSLIDLLSKDQIIVFHLPILSEEACISSQTLGEANNNIYSRFVQLLDTDVYYIFNMPFKNLDYKLDINSIVDPTCIVIDHFKVIETSCDVKSGDYFDAHYLFPIENSELNLSDSEFLDINNGIKKQPIATIRYSSVEVNTSKFEVSKFCFSISKDFFEKKIDEINYSGSKASIEENDFIRIIAFIYKDSNDRVDEIISVVKSISANNKEIIRYKIFIKSVRFCLQGPFDSSYSLALVNREKAISMHSLGYDITLCSTEGHGNFMPSEAFLKNNPVCQELFLKSVRASNDVIDVSSRNLYPPRVDDMNGTIKALHNYAWEETGFPDDWVCSFNENLDLIACTSEHVKKIFIDNGIAARLYVTGNGVDHWYDLDADNTYSISAKGFKFLHVSSCFPRKGIRHLLKAFCQVFSNDDDVSLIIKTFTNPHNNVREQINELKCQHANLPNIVLIDEDLTNEEIKSLYNMCDVLVSPSCAEGFGLPIAEAFMSDIPVITTNWSGQKDLCNDSNSWLVDFSFEKACSHFNIYTSVWASPKINDLADAMKDAFYSTKEKRAQMAYLGKMELLKKYQWKHVSQRYVDSIYDFLSSHEVKTPRIGWISPWHSKCGIATYSKHLTSEINPDDFIVFSPDNEVDIDLLSKNYFPCWQLGKSSNGLSCIIDKAKGMFINTIIMQFNYGFFNHNELSKFIRQAKFEKLNILIILHSTKDPTKTHPGNELKLIVDSLSLCDRLLVHSIDDLERLKSIGLLDNVALFPHGILKMPNPLFNRKKRPIVSCFGFCLPHKGIEELITAVSILTNQGESLELRLLNAEYPSPESSALCQKITDLISSLNLSGIVNFNSQFLSDQDILMQLADSDLIVFPYQYTDESASGAVRYGMAAKKPVMVSPLSIFNDLSDAVLRFDGTSPVHIAFGISNTLRDIKLKKSYIKNTDEAAKEWRKQFDYSRISRRLYFMCKSLLNNR